MKEPDVIPRVIPSLLLKGRGLYKGKFFKNHRYIGDPINTVKIFNDKKADELIFFDIEATQKNKIDFNFIKEIAGECFMPFAYGGGVNQLDHINRLIKIGVEKIVINTEAVKNNHFLKESIKEFGSSTIMVCVDYKSDSFGRKRVFIHSGSVKTKLDPAEWVKKLNDYGVGDIIINAIDREGSKLGFDIAYFKTLHAISDAPLIISGGGKNFEEIEHAIYEHHILGISAGSCFVFKGKHDAVLISYPNFNY